MAILQQLRPMRTIVDVTNDLFLVPRRIVADVSAQNCVGDLSPVRRLVENRIRNDCLTDNERGKHAQVDPVDAPIDDHVAPYPK